MKQFLRQGKLTKIIMDQISIFLSTSSKLKLLIVCFSKIADDVVETVGDTVESVVEVAESVTEVVDAKALLNFTSEVFDDLVTSDGALKLCEAAKENMEKTMKSWLKVVEEQEAEFEQKIANLKFTVQHMAQERETIL